jgi:two-component system KDP operon response regulator KdpE
VLQQLRDFTSAPVIILTASSDEQHIIRGLGLGADDYMAKPFKMDELIARIGALLRRVQANGQSGEPVVLHAGDLTIDLARRSVHRNGAPIELTPIEYRLLTYLARHAGQVLTHEQLLQHVWGSEYGSESQYLWVHIGRLRQKIEASPKAPRHVRTERGMGYRFEL